MEEVAVIQEAKGVLRHRSPAQINCKQVSKRRGDRAQPVSHPKVPPLRASRKRKEALKSILRILYWKTAHFNRIMQNYKLRDWSTDSDHRRINKSMQQILITKQFSISLFPLLNLSRFRNSLTRRALRRDSIVSEIRYLFRATQK